jgi:hypothetical protein
MFALILNWLGGGVLKSVLEHLKARREIELGEKQLQTSVTIKEIEAELARRNAQRDVLVKEAESKWHSMPRWCFGMTAWLYFAAVVVDSIWDLPGTVLTLPDNEAAIMGVIVGGLFLDSVGTKLSRALRK